jgi:hypothetical protein
VPPAPRSFVALRMTECGEDDGKRGNGSKRGRRQLVAPWLRFPKVLGIGLRYSGVLIPCLPRIAHASPEKVGVPLGCHVPCYAAGGRTGLRPFWPCGGGGQNKLRREEKESRAEAILFLAAGAAKKKHQGSKPIFLRGGSGGGSSSGRILAITSRRAAS